MNKFIKPLSIFIIMLILVSALGVTTNADNDSAVSLYTSEPGSDLEFEMVPTFEFAATDIGKSGLGHGIWAWGQDGAAIVPNVVPVGGGYDFAISFGESMTNGGWISLRPGTLDSNAKELAFDIDASEIASGAYLNLKFQIEYNDGSKATLAANDVYYLKNKNGTTTNGSIWQNTTTFDIPGGFVGTVVIPLADSGLENLNFANIKQYLFSFYSKNTGLSNKTIRFNNFGYTTTVGGEVINSFDFKASDIGASGLGHGIWAWSSDDDSKVSLSVASLGEGYQLAVPFSATTTYGLISVALNGVSKDASAVAFSVDYSNIAAETTLKVQLESSEGRLKPANGDTYYLVSKTETLSKKVNNNDGGLVIPAGFVGDIIVPLDNAGFASADPTKFTQFTLSFVSGAAKGLTGKTVYMNNFGYALFKTEDVEETVVWPYKTPENYVVFKDGTPASNQIYNWNAALKALAIEKKDDVNTVALTFPSNFNQGSSICIPITATSEKDAMIFSVDAAGLTEKMQVLVQYENGSKDSFVLAQGSEYYLRSSADSTVQKLFVDNAKGYVSIPAGFVGEVAISLDAAKLIRTRGSLEFSTAAISSLTLTISGNTALSDGKVYFYKFGYTVLGSDDDVPEEIVWPYKTPKSFVMFKDGTPASNQIYNWNAALKALAIEKKDDVNTVALTFPSNFNQGSSICIPITATSEKDAMIFTVDASSLSDTMQVIVQYENGSKDSFVLAQGSEYYLRSSADSTVQKLFVDNAKGYVSIPAGFVGEVAISLDAAKLIRTRGSLEFSTAAISSLTLTISGNTALSDGKVYFYKFGYTVLGSDDDAPEEIVWPYRKPESFVEFKDGTPGSNQVYNWNAPLKALAIENKNGVNVVAATFPSDFKEGTSIGIPITSTSGKDALIFTVDASSLSDTMQVIVQYENGSKDSFVLAQGSEYYLRSSADSTVQKLFVDNSRGYIAIPAGFVGEVAISLDAAKLVRTRGSLDFSSAAISSLTLTVSGNTALSNGKIYLSKFGYAVKGADIPQTGESSFVWVYSVIAFTSLAGLVLLLKKNHTVKTEE